MKINFDPSKNGRWERWSHKKVLLYNIIVTYKYGTLSSIIIKIKDKNQSETLETNRVPKVIERYFFLIYWSQKSFRNVSVKLVNTLNSKISDFSFSKWFIKISDILTESWVTMGIFHFRKCFCLYYENVL